MFKKLEVVMDIERMLRKTATLIKATARFGATLVIMS